MTATKSCNKPAKPYSKPTLTVYGKVNQLTNMVGNTNAFDGASGKMHKTAV